MAELYADENVPRPLVDALRALGHNVLTALDDGRANQKIPDPDVLARAISLGRAVLTNNHKHFQKLHRNDQNHTGIVTYVDEKHDRPGVAARIDAALATVSAPAGKLIRIVRPNTPQVP